MRDVLRIGGKYRAAVFESAAKVRGVDHVLLYGQDIIRQRVRISEYVQMLFGVSTMWKAKLEWCHYKVSLV